VPQLSKFRLLDYNFRRTFEPIPVTPWGLLNDQFKWTCGRSPVTFWAAIRVLTTFKNSQSKETSQKKMFLKIQRTSFCMGTLV